MHRDNWREFDAYLFDIDGTLLNCRDAVHYFAFCEVLSATAGRPIDLTGVTAHGNVDVGILRDAFALAGVDEAVWRPRLTQMQADMSAYCTAHAGELRVEPAPGARETLEALRGHGAHLGVATGNLAALGRLKLEKAGLWEFFTFAAWSDAFESRAAVFAHGVELARAEAGAQATVLALGDTPADIRAARANGIPVLAVATGVYSFAELAAEGPEWCFASLEAALAPKQ